MFTLLQMAKRDKSGAGRWIGTVPFDKKLRPILRGNFLRAGAGWVEPNPAWAGMLLDSLIEIFLSYRAGAPTLVDP